MKKRLIKVYVDVARREQFRLLARQAGRSESALLARTVESLVAQTPIQLDSRPADGSVCQQASAKTQRLNLRLTPAEQQAVVAAARHFGLPANRFAIAAIRAALRRKPELLKAELAALYGAITALNAVGRNLNQIARRLNEASEPARLNASDLKVIEAVAKEAKRVSRGTGAFCAASVERWV